MRYFEVKYKSNTVNLGGRNKNDPWSADSTASDVEVQGLFEVGADDYRDLVIADGPIDELYLLWCVYSTGDSFSRHSGKAEWVMLHRDSVVAGENARAIRAHYEEHRSGFSDDAYSVKLKTDEGEEFKVHVPWNGYFESLTDVIVERVYLQSKEFY